jgi:eukaryotic-like serine/threonine-protein kinase
MGLLGNLKSLFGSRVNLTSRFELLREAITGTMSNFYMARDRESGKIVGLKILDPEKFAIYEARFRGLPKPSEGEIGLSISHPNIMKTLEYGVSSDGHHFVVVEYLEGPGLQSVIVAKDKRVEGRRVKLLRQAAEALKMVHDSGFIHHDVCPRNFVCAKDLESLKLIDFGLTIPLLPEFMQPGNRTGTANYMAPEVVRRKSKDHRIDIFSFGAMAYELCAFKLPWEKGSGQEALLHDQPVDIVAARPTINPRLADAITRCLAPNPNDRVQLFDHFLAMIAKLKTEDDPP